MAKFSRPPKKFPQKSLHGRTRIALLTYDDFKNFQEFYVNVFGWDMFETPVAAGGKTPGDPQPNCLVATGPSYETWEGVVPGHMNAMAEQSGARFSVSSVICPPTPRAGFVSVSLLIPAAIPINCGNALTPAPGKNLRRAMTKRNKEENGR